MFTVVSGPVQQRPGVALFCLDGRHCRTKESLFEEWAIALSFPSHFGHNWDAFNDCFREFIDRSAMKGTSVLRISHAAVLLADADLDLAILMGVLQSAFSEASTSVSLSVSDEPNGGGRQIVIEWADEAEELPRLRARLLGAGWTW